VGSNSEIDFASASSINLASVSNTVYTNFFNAISDLIDNTVITDPNPPIVVGACEFSATGGSRVVREILNCRNHAGMYSRG
jgi:hypothetical protein